MANLYFTDRYNQYHAIHGLSEEEKKRLESLSMEEIFKNFESNIHFGCFFNPKIINGEKEFSTAAVKPNLDTEVKYVYILRQKDILNIFESLDSGRLKITVRDVEELTPTLLNAIYMTGINRR